MNDTPQNKVAKPQIMATRHFSGPIPPPEVLAQYEKIGPGLADRIIKMAEAEGNNRREREAEGQKAQIEHLKRRDWEAKLGQIFAFIISISAIIAGTVAAISGHDISGTFIGLSGLGGVVTTFIYGRKQESK